jgi:hypothetical protein
VNSVLKHLGSVNTLHKGRVEQASFAVLTAYDVPSILVETAFISNPEEEKRLGNKAYQDKLARAILEGIKDYLQRHPPRPSPVALSRSTSQPGAVRPDGNGDDGVRTTVRFASPRMLPNQ